MIYFRQSSMTRHLSFTPADQNLANALPEKLSCPLLLAIILPEMTLVSPLLRWIPKGPSIQSSPRMGLYRLNLRDCRIFLFRMTQ